MSKNSYIKYQLIGWLLVFLIINGSVQSQSAFFQWIELFYAFILIGATALGSHGIRLLYKKHIATRKLLVQLLYFLLSAFIVAFIATSLLVGVVFIFAKIGVIYPIPKSQVGIVLTNIYPGNIVNMWVALLLWSALYFSFVKVRQLHEVTQALASSKLDALVQQLNPHFLFNVLNDIRALILENPEKARSAVTSLSEILRYSLQAETERKVAHETLNYYSSRAEKGKVLLQEELYIVREYIKLCKIQYEDRLLFTEQIEANLETALVPQMLLQLCIENAMKHGVSRLPKGGEVRLEIWAQSNQSLWFKITNPYTASSETKTETGAGIAFKNIKKRLALLYPEAHQAKFDFEKNKLGLQGGTAQTLIKLPLELGIIHENSHY